MSVPAQPANDADSLSASDPQKPHVSSEIAFVPSLRNLFIQIVVVGAAILLNFLRRQQIPIITYWLNNWVIMPPECVLFTAVVVFQGVPILKRDYEVLIELLEF
jgi:hypothetical protein